MAQNLRKRVDTVILAGDIVGDVTTDTLVKLGPGLIQDQNAVKATKAGILRLKQPDTFFIENNQKRYTPGIDDMVIGIITDKLKDGWKVDIGCHELAQLDIMSFEGASKKNRANLPVGALVYCRVIVASRDMEPELSCLSAKGKKEGFGPLEGGYMLSCCSSLARDCLSEESMVLNELSKYFAFEVAVGINGRIWVNSTNTWNTISIANAIKSSQNCNPEQVQDLVAQIAKTKPPTY